MSENPVQMKKKLLAVLNEQKAVTAYDKKSGNISVCIKAVINIIIKEFILNI